MAEKIRGWKQSRSIGVCDPIMRRMCKQYLKHGYNGLFDQRRRKRKYLPGGSGVRSAARIATQTSPTHAGHAAHE